MASSRLHSHRLGCVHGVKDNLVTSATFEALGLINPLLRALESENYTEPTPIQAQAIPPLLQGRDVLGLAQTGTGKTAAFSLPLLQHLAGRQEKPAPRSTRALILVPTRELALQIAASLRVYGKNLRLTSTVLMGGVGFSPQAKGLARGVDMLIATPGRLLDHLTQGTVDLTKTDFFVIDEADRMLDMGFIRDVRKLIKVLPRTKQSILFSATMPKEIASLASDILKDPVRVTIPAKTVAVERIDQRVHHVSAGGKPTMLAEMLEQPGFERVIVFTRTKRTANRVAERLLKDGFRAEAIHGNKSQAARQKALENLKTGKARVLVATDIVSRGIDVDGISHVINYELPNDPEDYVHRIGRTARAGSDGIAISFCDMSERSTLRNIERFLGRSLTQAPGSVQISDEELARAQPPRSNGRGSRPAFRGSKPDSRASHPAPRSGSFKPRRNTRGRGVQAQSRAAS
jgi:ATP-dependent RNA helicase RhlE